MNRIKPRIVESELIEGSYSIKIGNISIGFISYESGRFVVSRYWSSSVGLELNVGERFVGTKPVIKENCDGNK